jgi:hypothetical protein
MDKVDWNRSEKEEEQEEEKKRERKRKRKKKMKSGEKKKKKDNESRRGREECALLFSYFLLLFFHLRSFLSKGVIQTFPLLAYRILRTRNKLLCSTSSHKESKYFFFSYVNEEAKH